MSGLEGESLIIAVVVVALAGILAALFAAGKLKRAAKVTPKDAPQGGTAASPSGGTPPPSSGGA